MGRRGPGADFNDKLLDGGGISERSSEPQGHAGAAAFGNAEAQGASGRVLRGSEGAAPPARVAAAAVAPIAHDPRGHREIELDAAGDPGRWHLDLKAPASPGRGIQSLGIDDLTQLASMHFVFVPQARSNAKQNPSRAASGAAAEPTWAAAQEASHRANRLESNESEARSAPQGAWHIDC